MRRRQHGFAVHLGFKLLIGEAPPLREQLPCHIRQRIANLGDIAPEQVKRRALHHRAIRERDGARGIGEPPLHLLAPRFQGNGTRIRGGAVRGRLVNAFGPARLSFAIHEITHRGEGVHHLQRLRNGASQIRGMQVRGGRAHDARQPLSLQVLADLKRPPRFLKEPRWHDSGAYAINRHPAVRRLLPILDPFRPAPILPAHAIAHMKARSGIPAELYAETLRLGSLLRGIAPRSGRGDSHGKSRPAPFDRQVQSTQSPGTPACSHHVRRRLRIKPKTFPIERDACTAHDLGNLGDGLTLVVVGEPCILVANAFRIGRCASGPERSPGIGNTERSAHSNRRAVCSALKVEKTAALCAETSVCKMPHMRFVAPLPIGIAVRMELYARTVFLRSPHAIQRHAGAIVEKPLARPSPMHPHRLRAIGPRATLELRRACVETRPTASLAQGKRAVAGANGHEAKRPGETLVFMLHRYPMAPRRGRRGEHAASPTGPRPVNAQLQRRHRCRGDDKHAAGPLRLASDAHPFRTLLDPLRGKADRGIVGPLGVPILPVGVIVPKPRPQLTAMHRITVDASNPHRVIRSGILAVIGPHMAAIPMDARSGLVIDDHDFRPLFHAPLRRAVDGMEQGETRIIARIRVPQVIRGVQLVIASACDLELAPHVVIQLRCEIACHGDLGGHPDELPRGDVPFNPRRFRRYLQTGVHIPRLLGACPRLRRTDFAPKPAGITRAISAEDQ